MAIPNESDFSDIPSVSDRGSEPSDRNPADLSANVWQEMRVKAEQSPMAARGQQSDVLEFDNIFACADSDPKKQLHNIKDIKDVAEKRFDEIDADKDGFLTKDELEKAKENQCLSADEREALDILAKHQQGMSELSNDEFGFENDGITKADLKAFDKYYDEYKQSSDMSYYGNTEFTKIDKDGDGFLSSDELDKAIAASDDKSSERYQALVRIREQYDDLMSVENDEFGPESKGISWRDLAGNAIDKSGGAGGFFDDPTLLVSMNNDLSDFELKNRRPFVRH